jgi:hypothetical protein
MELLLSLRGKLETTTKIENWWKSQADEHGYFTRFALRVVWCRVVRVSCRVRFAERVCQRVRC